MIHTKEDIEKRREYCEDGRTEIEVRPEINLFQFKHYGKAKDFRRKE